jgi:hypothetical protein
MLKITLKTDMTGCCDNESTRYALGGILVEKGDNPIVAATDSRCLAITRAEGTCDEDVIVPISVVPKNGDVNKVNFITSVKSEGKTVCQSYVAKAKKFNGEPEKLAHPINGANVTTKAGESLEGRFPRYRDVIPKPDTGNKFIVTLDPKMMVNVHKAINTDLEENQGLTMIFTLLQPKNLYQAAKELTYRIEFMKAAAEAASEEDRLAIYDPCLQSMHDVLALVQQDIITATDTAVICDGNAGIGAMMPMCLGNYSTDLDDAKREIKVCADHVRTFTGDSPPSKPAEVVPKTRKERKAKAAQHEEPVHESPATSIPVAEVAAEPEPASDDEEEADPALIAMLEEQTAAFKRNTELIQQLMASLNV